MAKNDVVLLDAILEQRLADGVPSSERDEVFEYLAFEQVLKDYDLSRDELESGWTDGRDDGGIDGLFIFVNGNLLVDGEDFAWPKSNASIDVWLFTCKHHATFQQAPLDSMLATIHEIFDLSLDKHQFRGIYSDDVVRARALFQLAYKRLSITHPVTTFHVMYASRGNTDELGESVVARARQIESVFSSLFSSCTARFSFVGSSELVTLHRKVKRFSLDLPFVEHLATGKDSYVLLVRLDEYCKFVTDENGNLRRYLFDSNVRDFLGPNQVNEDIAASLADESAPDFWWLNNGVTVLATSATVPGKTIQLQDIQIVNGLQTTETIFRHFQVSSQTSHDRTVLVKIIVSTDPLVRDRIIRATNNQSLVEIAALHATEKIQRDIEEILERHGWFYERRKNYYRNVGKPQAQLLTPMYLATAVVALILKNPSKATRLKSKFMRNAKAYEAIFSDRFPLEVWPTIVGIYKATEQSLAQVIASRHGTGERFISSWRGLVSLMAVARLTGTYSYDLDALLQVNAKLISQAFVNQIWDVILHVSKTRERTIRPRGEFARDCCKEAATRFNLLGIDDIGIRDVPPAPPARPASLSSINALSQEFVAAVDLVLPQQPWKPGIHAEVAAKLKCKPSKVQKAIQHLIADGKRYEQRDGVVYDAGGKVIGIDPERVVSKGQLS